MAFGYTILGFGSGGAVFKAYDADYLILAGGGAGGPAPGGGGGAGGMRTSFPGGTKISIDNFTIPIDVGAGGTAGTGGGGTGLTKGLDSTISLLSGAFSSSGGGGGVNNPFGTGCLNDGGSGGGTPHQGSTKGCGNLGGYTPPEGQPGGASGAGCFIAGTKVRMADGTDKNIEDVLVDDKVKGHKEDNTVIKLKPTLLADRKLYSFNDNDHYFFTSEHPFMTEEGWKSIKPEKTKERDGIELFNKLKGTLKIGDKLITEDGSIEIIHIKSKEINDPKMPLYNFHVSNDNSYIADGYVVHNKGSFAGSGGGGHTGAGSDATGVGYGCSQGSPGGNGTANSITAAAVTRAGGGGGGAWPGTPSPGRGCGGTGGGGAGGAVDQGVGANGTDGLGGGSGGGTYGPPCGGGQPGGVGGTGTIIIRIPSADAPAALAVSPGTNTIATDAPTGDKICTFTVDGILTVG